MDVRRFTPHYDSGQVLSATNTSAQASITGQALAVRITNFDTTNVAYIRIGEGVFTASNADYPIRPNSEVWVTKPYGADKIAYYSPATASIHVIDGEGI